MSTHRSTWKRRERNAAKLFGAKRQILSGSSGRSGTTTSDSTHPRLYIETKLRSWSSVRTLWEKTREAAHQEGKTPVLVLYTKRKAGALIVMHEDEMAAVAAERMVVPEQPREPSTWLQELEPFQPE